MNPKQDNQLASIISIDLREEKKMTFSSIERHCSRIENHSNWIEYLLNILKLFT